MYINFLRPVREGFEAYAQRWCFLLKVLATTTLTKVSFMAVMTALALHDEKDPKNAL